MNEELLLCLFGGWLGLHCFAKKQWVKGIVYLLTFGIFGIGWIIDIIHLIKIQNDFKLNEYDKKIIDKFTTKQCKTFKNIFIILGILLCLSVYTIPLGLLLFYVAFTYYKYYRIKIKNDTNYNPTSKDLRQTQNITYTLYQNNITNNISENKPINKYVVLDFETTGLNYILDEITEFSILKYENGILIDEINELVNPNKTIPDIVVKKTGITNEMVKNKPNISSYIVKIFEFIKDYPVVGHNITFDLDFLCKAIKNNANTLSDVIQSNITFDYIDTCELAKLNIKNVENYKLETLKKYLNLENESHRAKEDCYVTNELFNYIINQIREEKELEKIEYENRLKNLKEDENKFIEYFKNKIKELDTNLELKFNISKAYLISFYVNDIYLGRVKLRGKKYKIELITNNNNFELDDVTFDEVCKHSEKWIKYLKTKL